MKRGTGLHIIKNQCITTVNCKLLCTRSCKNVLAGTWRKKCAGHNTYIQLTNEKQIIIIFRSVNTQTKSYLHSFD